MPLDLSVLRSKDPTGRKAEAVRRGEKVKASDYEAVIEESSKLMGTVVEDSGNHHIYYSVKRKTLDEKEAYVKAGQERKETRAEDFQSFQRRRDERQQAEMEKTAKRRAKRAKKAKKAE